MFRLTGLFAVGGQPLPSNKTSHDHKRLRYVAWPTPHVSPSLSASYSHLLPLALHSAGNSHAHNEIANNQHRAQLKVTFRLNAHTPTPSHPSACRPCRRRCVPSPPASKGWRPPPALPRTCPTAAAWAPSESPCRGPWENPCCRCCRRGTTAAGAGRAARERRRSPVWPWSVVAATTPDGWGKTGAKRATRTRPTDKP